VLYLKVVHGIQGVGFVQLARGCNAYASHSIGSSHRP
jgi:hypothetical protein